MTVQDGPDGQMFKQLAVNTDAGVPTILGLFPWNMTTSLFTSPLEHLIKTSIVLFWHKITHTHISTLMKTSLGHFSH